MDANIWLFYKIKYFLLIFRNFFFFVLNLAYAGSFMDNICFVRSNTEKKYKYLQNRQSFEIFSFEMSVQVYRNWLTVNLYSCKTVPRKCVC